MSPIKAGAMIAALLLLSLTLLNAQPRVARAALQTFETRCGWFSNPTPGNASLYDRDDEWIIGVQGGYQAEGDWPVFGPKQWVETNVHYGYGCACMSVTIDREKGEVIQIKSAKARPLSTCRSDRALKRWRDFK